MSAMTTRQRAMLGAIGALALAVIADRAGLWRPGALLASGGDGGPAAERYAALEGIVAAQKRLAAERDTWKKAAADAAAQWAKLRERVIVAPSVDLAEGRLRDEVNREAQALGFETPTAASLGAAAPAGDAKSPAKGPVLRVVGLRLEFGAEKPEPVYTLIDRLENLPSIAAAITLLELKGPGVVQLPHRIDVTIELRALAAIGEEGES